ncbi:hypothetical protein KC19_5G065600 [Ceratodon purpureus]|uniref:Uncharacterized protein n=1 Tax=Ceratodon purpureus TaxID=3225 RepID=A0A8T0I111_CERPU|nr:hypothetical protein KC19_5G065600 [Ceratodon purpureus]
MLKRGRMLLSGEFLVIKLALHLRAGALSSLLVCELCLLFNHSMRTINSNAATTVKTPLINVILGGV